MISSTWFCAALAAERRRPAVLQPIAVEVYGQDADVLGGRSDRRTKSVSYAERHLHRASVEKQGAPPRQPEQGEQEGENEPDGGRENALKHGTEPGGSTCRNGDT